MQGLVRGLPAYGTLAGHQHRALPAAYSRPVSSRPSSSASAVESLAGPLYPLGLASSQAGISTGSPAAGLLREAAPTAGFFAPSQGMSSSGAPRTPSPFIAPSLDAFLPLTALDGSLARQDPLPPPVGAPADDAPAADAADA